MLYFSKSGNVFVFENVFVKRRTWSSLASSLLVLLQLVFADLVPDPLQRDVELVLHPVHVLHSMSDFWSLHNISHVEQCLVINHFGSGAQIHFIFPASSSQISQKISFLGLWTKKLCHRPPWSCLQRLHPRPPRGRSPLQLLLQQDLHRPSLCQQLAAGGKVLQGTKAWWVSHLRQTIFARSDRFLHRCGMEAWQLRKYQGGGLPRWPGSQVAKVGNESSNTRRKEMHMVERLIAWNEKKDENTWHKSKGNDDGEHFCSNWIRLENSSIKNQVTFEPSI